MTDNPLVPWKEIAAQSIDRVEALEAERDGFRAEVGLLLLSVKTFEGERDELRAENERLRASQSDLYEALRGFFEADFSEDLKPYFDAARTAMARADALGNDKNYCD